MAYQHTFIDKVDKKVLEIKDCQNLNAFLASLSLTSRSSQCNQSCVKVSE